MINDLVYIFIVHLQNKSHSQSICSVNIYIYSAASITMHFIYCWFSIGGSLGFSVMPNNALTDFRGCDGNTWPSGNILPPLSHSSPIWSHLDQSDSVVSAVHLHQLGRVKFIKLDLQFAEQYIKLKMRYEKKSSTLLSETLYLITVLSEANGLMVYVIC